MINIKYTLCRDGYVHAGLIIPVQKIRPKLKGPLLATARAMMDTGCSSMVAGTDFVTNLDLKIEDLVPVKTVVWAANRTDIKIIGATIVNIKTNAPGSLKMKKKVAFISDMATIPYLNLEACKHLGLVPESFPRVTVDGVQVESRSTDRCGHGRERHNLQLSSMNLATKSAKRIALPRTRN